MPPLNTTSFPLIDDSLYANITDFINKQCKKYGDELASNLNRINSKSRVRPPTNDRKDAPHFRIKIINIMFKNKDIFEHHAPRAADF